MLRKQHKNGYKHVLLDLLLFLQTQEEVCDLKHAAPFQNIIPKPFIPIKGKSNQLACQAMEIVVAQISLFWVSLYWVNQNHIFG